MFTYVGLITLTEEGREHPFKESREYLEKIQTIVSEEGGELERVFAIMGPWDYLAVFKYPENEAAFRALAKIAELKVVKTETFLAEDVEVFFKALV
ncbi:MAG TPA: GYD domain-containing protein [Gaiellaceae bacterium]|nr:GYD domain-containing protein [Gaiellaceae bacterium]